MRSKFKIILITLLTIIQSAGYSIVFTTTQAGGNSSKDLNVQAGKQYQVKFDLNHQTTSAVRIQIIEGSTVFIDETNLIDGTHVFSFTPTTNTVTLKFVREDADNVSRDFEVDKLVYEEITQVAQVESNHEIGRKEYYLTDHLGNVRVVVSDKKVNGSVEVVSATDYLPFGMSARSYTNGVKIRHGFNGKEKDDEGMGGGGPTYDYGFRICNPALCKFLSVDPLTGAYPWYTPYQFAGNMPIISIDLDGLEEFLIVYYKNNDQLRGWAIKRLEMTVASTVKLEQLKSELAAVKTQKQDRIKLYDFNVKAGYKENKKQYEQQLALFDMDIQVAEEKLLAEQKRVEEENKMIQEQYKGKAVYLTIENSNVSSVDEVISETDKKTLTDYQGLPISDLDGGAKKVLENANGNANVQTFNTTPDIGDIYALHMPTSFSGDALFASSSYVLSEKGKNELTTIAQTLIANSNLKIEIVGHTDNTGDATKNIQLSVDRAMAVKDFLVSQGVNANQIQNVSGVGASVPIGSNNSEEGKAQNRRVEIKQVNN